MIQGIFRGEQHLVSKTIFFYIVKEILFAFFVCFLFFFFVFFVNQFLLMAREVLSKRVPVHQVALLILYAIPSIIALAAPFASLSGTLMIIGRLSSDNEILVMLSSGMSYRAVFLPAAAVGILISLISFFANDILLPLGTVQYSRLYRRILISTPALELEANSVRRFRNTEVVTGPVSGHTMRDVIIMDRTSSGERRYIIAGEASLKEGENGGVAIDLERAFVETVRENVREDYDYASSAGLEYTIPRNEVNESYSVGPREMSSVDVRKEIRKKEKSLADNLNLEERNLTQAALVLENALRRRESWNRIETLEKDHSDRLESLRSLKRDRSLSIYRIEYFKKFSIPFGALSFVLLAVAIGLMTKKNGQAVGFIVGISLSALYWAFLMGGHSLGMQMGFSPFWSMWFPNILAAGLGVILSLARIRR